MSFDRDIIKEGFFQKQGGSIINLSFFKRRYFVLYDTNTLTYAESKTAEAKEIELKYVTHITDQNKHKQKNTFGMTMQTVNNNDVRIWSFCFETEQERDSWLDALTKCTQYNNTNVVETQQEFEEKENTLKQLLKDADKLKQNLDIKTRRHYVHKYKNCFVGEEAVKMIINLKIAKNETDAVIFGNALVKNNIIAHVEREHLFKNGYFFYHFIDASHLSRNNTLETISQVIKTAKEEKDIISLIHKCSDKKTMLDTLFNSLCTEFESEENHVRFEQYSDKMGETEALVHFMKRHTYIHIRDYDPNVHSYILNRFCQCIDYVQSENMLYNYKSLAKMASISPTNKCNRSLSESYANVPNITKSKRRSLTSSNGANDSISFSSASRHLTFRHESLELGLKDIHSMSDIILFAALPVSTQNVSDTNNLNSDICACLFRVLPTHKYKVLSMVHSWKQDSFAMYSLYDLEEFIGLFFYKTIGEFFVSKYNANKLPIPFINKVNITDVKEQSEMPILHRNSNVERRMQRYWTETPSDISVPKPSCIEAFDRIIYGRDHDFPRDLNMFNVVIMVWVTYRKHVSHIKCDKNVNIIKLKLQFFTKFLNCLFRHFFMELDSRKHLTKYMLILHYFASPKFDNYSNNIKKSQKVNWQIHIFEMALIVSKTKSHKRQIFEFLHTHQLIQKSVTPKLHLEQELKCIEHDLNTLYAEISQNEYYKRIDSNIKIVSGNVIFRQDHQHVLGKMRNKTSKNDSEFEYDCAWKMLDIAEILSNQFTNNISEIFNHKYNDKISVFELPTKPRNVIKKHLGSMVTKNIKFPKSASIRDYMSCLVVFPTIKEMIAGYHKLHDMSRKYGIQIVHIENGITKKFNKESLDNFRLINVHVIFRMESLALIGQISFALLPIWKRYSMKKYIIDSYSLLLGENKAEFIAKELSISENNRDYDWKIKRLYDMQDQWIKENMFC